MTCKNLIGERCKLDCQICKHLVYDGKCPLAEVSSIGKATFRDAIAAVREMATKKPWHDVHAIELIMSEGNYHLDDEVEKLTWDDAELIVRKMLTRYEPSSVAHFFGILYRIGGDKFRPFWRERHLQKPVFDRYHVEVPHKAPPVLTPDQKRAIKFHMEELRRDALDEAKTPYARQRCKEEFIMFWMGRYFGTRTTDAVSQNWSCIQTYCGQPYMVFTPSKTKHLNSDKNDVYEPISPQAYDDIYPFIGQPDEPMIPLHEECTPKDKVCKGHRNGVIIRVNKFFRSIGCTVWAAFYNMRYWSSQETYVTEGEDAESRKHSHGKLVGRTHYYNPHDHRSV